MTKPRSGKYTCRYELIHRPKINKTQQPLYTDELKPFSFLFKPHRMCKTKNKQLQEKDKKNEIKRKVLEKWVILSLLSPSLFLATSGTPLVHGIPRNTC